MSQSACDAACHRRTLVCTASYCAAHGLDPAKVPVVLPDDHDLLWLDLENPSDDELGALVTEFGFHELAIEDASKQHQRAKIDPYESFTFLVLFSVTLNEQTQRMDAHELDVFLGTSYVVSVHHWPIGDIDRTTARAHTDLRTLDHGVAALLYSLCDTIVDAYLPIADQIRDRVQALERRVFAPEHPRTRAALHEDIFSLRSELLKLRSTIGPQRDVLAVLSHRGLPMIDSNTALYFHDVADHLQRVIETIDVYHQMLASVLDSYNAQSSNALNQVMRVLTSFSIILMSISFIAGVYGMNFNTSVSPFNMPELNAYLGYPFVLLLMGVVAGVLAFLLRYRGWL